MFAGIVERAGSVVRIGSATRSGGGADATRLEIEMGELLSDLTLGASVAVNGVCLTLADARDGVGGFDVIPETLARSTLGSLAVGDLVNIERSLRVGDRIDGHFVQGHVDGTGLIQRVDRRGGEYKLWVATGATLMPFIVPKGSIAIDGVSLTIVDVTREAFSVALIPTTLERTSLGRRKGGDAVNLETDILARLVVSRLDALGATGPTGVTFEHLRAAGFAS